MSRFVSCILNLPRSVLLTSPGSGTTMLRQWLSLINALWSPGELYSRFPCGSADYFDRMHNVGHNTRTLLVSKRYPNLLMASVGSDGNIDLPSFHPASGRAQIRVFDLDTLPNDGVTYTQGRVLGYGLRNDVGMAEDGAGIVHSVENSMDNAYRTINGVRTDVHNDNPGEPVWHRKSNSRHLGNFLPVDVFL